MIYLLFTSNDVIPGKHNQTESSVECDSRSRKNTGIMINAKIGS